MVKLVLVGNACIELNEKNGVCVVPTGEPATTTVFKGLVVRSQLKSNVKAGSNDPRGDKVRALVAPEIEPTPLMPPKAPPPPPTPAPMAAENSASGIVAPTA